MVTSQRTSFSWRYFAAIAALFVGLLLVGGSASARSGAKGTPGPVAPGQVAKQTRQDLTVPLTQTTCGPAWRIVESPNITGIDNRLSAVKAISANDVWAVGRSGFSGALTLAMHWDGTEWSIVTTPNATNEQDYLYAVDAVSSSDVWAVGVASGQPLVEHWNGSEWSIVPSPSIDSVYASLNGLSIVSANDIWAVGHYFNIDGLAQTLAMHWDGSAWTVVPTPNVLGIYNSLAGVAAVAANDIWAVGFTGMGYGQGSDTLAMHWDGSSWTQVSTPSPGLTDSQLFSVTAVSASDIWAVGNSTEGGSWHTLALHWNGTEWRQVATANPGRGANSLYGLFAVSAVSANDVWAVGNYFGECAPVLSLTEHWNGTQWSMVASPNVDPRPTLLNGLDALSSTDVWAVGDYESPSIPWPQTLAEHYTTPVVRFTDVCPQDYFGYAVQYLNDHGAISGYADGTFRPYASITRGQVSKVVALALNVAPYTPATPTFLDVPATNPFFPYVESLHHAGAVSGYGDNTFRPSAPVTRAQLAKIVVLAAGWGLPTTVPPTFSDVPVTHPFFRYIEAAHCRCVLHGYADGTFRPANGATRGQVAKVSYFAAVGGYPCTSSGK